MKLKQLILFVVLLIASCWFGFSLIAQPTSGMVGFFKMDGNLTNTGSASMTATPYIISYGTSSGGAPNKTLQFGGSTSSYVKITDNGNLDFLGDFSIAFGLFMPSLASTQGFYDNGSNYGGVGVWYFSSDNTLRLNFKNGSLGAVGALAANQWKAVCAVRTGSTIKLYVNGVQVASGPEGTMGISYPYAPVLGQMYFAGGSGNYNPAANGTKIDELRFYNRALSAAEISQLVEFSLPMKLGDFTASKQSAGIKLNWETLSEQNTSHFEIERSGDGINYSSICIVNAAGNSADKKYYSFTDNHPLSGINFYRLKMADIDGTYTFSRVIAIKNDNSLITIQIFPNPVTDVLQVQIPSSQKEAIKIAVADAAGRIIFERNMEVAEGNNAASIPVQQLPKGNYYLVVDNREGRQAKPFIKQ